MATTETVPQWTLADRLVKSRQVAGLGQKDMADHLGVSVAAVSKFERGFPVRNAYLYAWALKCGVPFDWLRGDDDVSPFSEQPRRRSGWTDELPGTTAA